MQAKYMKEGTNFTITYMWLGDPVTIIVGLLIFNTFVYKFLNTRHRSFTITTKFVIGMCFACMTMCIAGSVEYYRQQGCLDNHDLGNNDSSLQIYYQLPQNIFMGFSEIFAMLASFEYAYFAAPRSAQTLFMSLRFCSLGVSSFIASGYLTIFSSTQSQMDFNVSTKLRQCFFFLTFCSFDSF
jgi:dipeptide/tripeptide permease